MNFEEFIKTAVEYQLNHPDQRWGQAIFNVLHVRRPDLAHRIDDPFYVTDPEKLKTILEQLKSIWC